MLSLVDVAEPIPKKNLISKFTYLQRRESFTFRGSLTIYIICKTIIENAIKNVMYVDHRLGI